MIQPKRDIPVAPYTYYRIGGVAREVYLPADAREFSGVLTALHRAGTPLYILGGGSNVLVGDGYWDGAVIVTTGMDRVETYDDRLFCGAGLLSTRAAETALEHGRTGLEFLYLLPGTIGGALAMNARYDYTDIADVLVSMTAAHPERGLRTFVRGELDFAYKTTAIVGEGWYICEATLRWEAGDPAAIRTRMDAIAAKRKEGRHFDHPSCGCVFKNDYDNNIRVGRLLDELGFKGRKIGGAEVAPYHANFIINTGGATARDILTLIETIEREVLDSTGVRLQREVRLLGSFD